MKTTHLFAIISLFSFCGFAQSDSGFGITGGLNFSANGDYISSAIEVKENPKSSIGYHVGIFGKLGTRFYIRPELVYTQTKSDYTDSSFSMRKLDAPVLIGTKIIGPLHIFAGPAFQYLLESDFDDINITSIENDFSVGLQFGVGINLGKMGIDIRYERGLTTNEASFTNNNITPLEEGKLDTRLEQIIVNLSIKL